MIPTRYAGSWHCFVLTINEEGFKGIFRGYSAFLF